ncbi:hypothetical protein [uncultured Roseibium sp.]
MPSVQPLDFFAAVAHLSSMSNEIFALNGFYYYVTDISAAA